MSHPRSIVEAVAIHAQSMPGEIAVAAGENRLSYSELWVKTSAAAHLIQHHCDPGSPILLSSIPGQLSFVVGYLGAHLAGCPVIPIDNRTPNPVVRWLAAKAGAKLAIRCTTVLQKHRGLLF